MTDDTKPEQRVSLLILGTLNDWVVMVVLNDRVVMVVLMCRGFFGEDCFGEGRKVAKGFS
ncbi:hypothetical protein HanIR_Chr11g0545231 [Helianthus annuus]|nr:hypothetical protein HanIR_Chr11g0545231 [Helianthus annuus]